ncbi:hypothetical protein [Halovivax asiaticus]|uniref:hypothetical protein n=1 Tax=Halovivax asiaticus TaxID=332953 RepID=UPI0012676A27|nr:hypothetical protein [Halovivax asiaticus]
MVSRRKFVGVIAAASGLGTVGTVNARGSGKVSLAEAGLLDVVKGLAQKGETEEMHKIMDENNVEYYSGYDSLGPSINATQWSKGDSDMHATLTRAKGDDVYFASNETTLSGSSGLKVRDARRVDDAIGIDWDHDNWTPTGRTDSNVYLSAYGEMADKDYLEVEYDNYSYYGVAAKVKYDFSSPVRTMDTEFTVNLMTELIKETDDPRHGVKSHYEHTYSATPGAIDISIGAGGFSVSTPFAAGSWELEKDSFIDNMRD